MKKNHSANFFPMMMFWMMVLLYPSVLPAGEQKSGIDYTRIEKKVLELMDSGKIPGLSHAIVNQGQPDYIKGFGYAGVEKQVPVTADTLFELGSTSKAFTAREYQAPTYRGNNPAGYIISNVLLKITRDTQNDFLSLLNGLISGFKELSLHKETAGTAALLPGRPPYISL